MDIATLCGLVGAIGLVFAAIAQGGETSWFFSGTSAMIVLGGTMGATFLSYPFSKVLSVFRVAKNAFFHRAPSPDTVIPLIVELGKKARSEGILSFESQLKDIEEPFLVKGLQLAVDGLESNSIENILTTEILFLEERHRFGAEIFSTMGGYAPAIGMLGTIIGLIQMLMQMDDPSKIGEPMALALLTTFYGTLLANLIFLPISGKLKTRSKEEVLIKQMMLDGIMAIQAGDNHRVVEQKLNAYLAPARKDREKQPQA